MNDKNMMFFGIGLMYLFTLNQILEIEGIFRYLLMWFWLLLPSISFVSVLSGGWQITYLAIWIIISAFVFLSSCMLLTGSVSIQRHLAMGLLACIMIFLTIKNIGSHNQDKITKIK